MSASQTASERKRMYEVVAIVVTTLLLIGLSRLETRLFGLSETLAKNHDFITTVVYFGLINFNVILILVLSFLLFRNVAKLVVERRRGVFGSNLRTKLVATLVFFALAPTVLFFYISSRFIINSFDEWFSDKVRTTMQQTAEAGARVYEHDKKRLEGLARIAMRRIRVLSVEERIMPEDPAFVADDLAGFDSEYGLDGVKVYDTNANLVWQSRERTIPVRDAPDPFVVDALVLFKNQPGLWSASTVKPEEEQDVVKGVAPVLHPVTRELHGIVMTETRFETQILKSIELLQTGFANLRPGAQLIKLSYLILLVVMTLLIMFAAVWLGFYVARGITRPIQSLAEATREVALGNYDISLASKTDDETGQLVRSFNLMTKDLARHRSETEATRHALVKSNDELDQRGKYMEVLLKNITAGVISVDSSNVITSVNSAAERLLGIDGQTAIGCLIEKGIGPSLYQHFWQPLEERLTSRATFSAQLDMSEIGREQTLLADATRIYDENGQNLGITLVFDDATEQVKAQRVAAWREVARRIAHEIKNPVTPIKLSAQRLLRRFHDQFKGEEREVFESCVETILKQVDSLRDLVNEFSKFARLPAIQPKMGHIDDVINDVVNLYKMSYPHIQFNTKTLARIPEFPLDKDQMNRVFVNLLSNAIAATEKEDRPKINFSGEILEDLNTVRVEVTDNGCGIPSHLRDRALEPYYSTKDEGTGLGLAIVNQIISDHGGYVRIAGNQPRGTKVVIELPMIAPRPT